MLVQFTPLIVPCESYEGTINCNAKRMDGWPDYFVIKPETDNTVRMLLDGRLVHVNLSVGAHESLLRSDRHGLSCRENLLLALHQMSDLHQIGLSISTVLPRAVRQNLRSAFQQSHHLGSPEKG
jgi:hypothetical protein